MAPDDRDRSFEKALARHLRSSSRSGPDAALSAASASSCPDAETLAAYHDGTLSAEERNLWKAHVLACDDCQLILSHLVEPLEVAVALESREMVAATAARGQASFEPQQAPSSARAASPAPIVISSPRKTYFRWLVPAGAIAAGLLAFVVFRESRRLHTLSTERIEVANNRQPVATPPLPAPSSAPPEARERSAKEEPSGAAPRKDQSLVAPAGATASAPVSRDDVLLKEQQRQIGKTLQHQAEPSQQYAYAPPASGPRINQQQQQQALRVLDAGPANDAKKARSETDAELGEGKDLAAKVAPAPAPPVAPLPSDQPSFMADNSVTSREARRAPAAARAPAAKNKAPAGAAGGAPASEATATGALAQTVEVQSSASSALMIQAGLAQGPSTFRSPTGDVLWRVGPAGSLERSSDNGTTWTPQASGVTADLATGVALSPRVCWIVGASGTILRTTDGGARWIKIGSPADAAIISIRATDAFHATIVIIDDPKTGATKSFKTADGGVNWSPVSNN